VIFIFIPLLVLVHYNFRGADALASVRVASNADPARRLEALEKKCDARFKIVFGEFGS